MQPSLDRWHQKTIGACRTKRPSARKTGYWHERSKVWRCTSAKNSKCQLSRAILYLAVVYVFLCFWCVAVSRTSRSTKKYENCFEKEGVCFVTIGRKKNQEDARIFCDVWPQKSVLPTLSNDSRRLVFDEFLKEAQSVTNNQPVWLDIRRQPVGSSDSVIVVRNRNILTQNRN